MPPQALDQRLSKPVDNATLRSVTGRSWNSRLFSSVMASRALPKVSGSCGSARSSAPIHRSCHPSDGHANTGARNETFTCADDHCRCQDYGSYRLSQGSGAYGLHGLDGERRSVVDAGGNQGYAKAHQDTGRIDLQDRDIGDNERNERAEIAEGSGKLREIESVLHGASGRRRSGFQLHGNSAAATRLARCADGRAIGRFLISSQYEEDRLTTTLDCVRRNMAYDLNHMHSTRVGAII